MALADETSEWRIRGLFLSDLPSAEWVNCVRAMNQERTELQIAVRVLVRQLVDAETRAAYFAAELVSIKEPLRGEITNGT